ncbi:MAG: DegT/DnrJ/EryC1/StrS family aminotransferase [Bacteroidales bacterium]|nr:DegT/DnrJ/EryC1/StrS family aminotransferase [Bacteroidales bacterium]MBR5778969.1 DegT/DnrJ/EryC1/StrS family aminotransferase [Bacteroidales bacterium]
MEFRDLKRQYNVLKPHIDYAMQEVLASGRFIMGQQVEELEEKLAQYVGAKHCITCANGTDALVLALKVLGIGEGDVVFVPDFTFYASAEAVSAVGAVPVFVDVDKHTFNIDTKDLKLKIQFVKQIKTYTPKAIMAVDLFGLPAPYSELTAIARANNLYIVEDGAQGFGGSIGNKMSCSFGDIATTSFFPAKPLGCYGDGGALFTNNDEWADMSKSLRMHGKGANKYDNVRVGTNSRLDTLQAAILLVKLNAFANGELQAVNQVAEAYNSGMPAEVKIPFIPSGYTSSWAQYTITLPAEELRNQLQEYLKQQDIPSVVYYPKPLSMQPVYKQLPISVGKCTVADMLSKTVLSLPMHPYLTAEEVEYIIETVQNFFKQE